MNKPKFKHVPRHYLTAIEKKHLLLAFDYFRKNGMNECKVNQKMLHLILFRIPDLYRPLKAVGNTTARRRFSGIKK